MKVGAFVVSLSLVFAAGQASAKCKPSDQDIALYCSSPFALHTMYDAVRTSMMFTHYLSQDIGEPVYQAGCGFVPPNVKTASILEERAYKVKDGVATIVNVSFGTTLSHEVDTYAEDGQYEGKKRVSFASGWMLKRSLVCTPD
ncbi:hypothetical protein [Paraburkholderia sp. EG304]|uniref:hypothetical protein n=1 Tax=Paraburkholderia sp. EG304 TaxID=3237015 RepID=UPI00397B54BD